MIYHKDNGGHPDIYAIRADGSGNIALATSADEERAKLLSGDRLVYQRVVASQYDIYSVKVDGTGTVALANSALSEYAVGMAGSRLVYVRQNASTWDMFSVLLDGTGGQQLASNIVSNQFGTGLLIQGDQIFFTSLVVGNTGLYSIHADGTGLLTLYSSTKNVYLSSVAAGKAVFAQQETSGYTLHAVNLDGTAHAALTSAGAYFAQGVMGNRLVYLIETLSTFPYRYSLYSVNLDGTDARAIGANPAKDQRNVRILGNRLIFDLSDSSISEVYSCNADGTGMVPVSPIGQVFHIAGAGAAGDHVVLMKGQYTDPTIRLYTVAVDGTGLTSITAGTEPAFFRACDGGRVYYVLQRAGQMDLLSCAIDGSGTLTLGGSPSLNEDDPIVLGGWVTFDQWSSSSGSTSANAIKTDGTGATQLGTGNCQVVLMQ